MVSPLMRTPTAMMASKGPLEFAPVERAVRSLVEAPRRSVAEGAPEALDWICDAEKSLWESE
jgi:hypothetical protein